VSAPTERVLNAIDEIRETFPETEVTYDPDGEGGAWVTIEQVSLGPAFVQETSWMAFQITHPYPESDVYPHFVRADLQRVDGNPHDEGFAVTSYGLQNVQAMQLSRRSNNLDPSVDTASSKALKVLKWLGER